MRNERASSSESLRGHAAMLLFSTLVAGSFSLGGALADEVPSAALNGIRFVIAACVIAPVAFLTSGFPSGWTRAPWRYALLGGVFALYFVAMLEGLRTASPVSSAAVFTLVPIMAAGFGWLLLRQRLTARMALALGIGLIGALWVIFRADLAALLAFEVGRGEVIFFWGCIAHAIYTPLVRKLNRGEPPIVFTFGTLLGGSVVLIAYSWGDLRAIVWSELSVGLWVGLLYLAIAASAVTFFLVQYATLRLPAAKVMAYTYLVPSWVICWEMVRHGAAPNVVILIGVALSVVALFLLLKDDD